nr:stage V sporulation protein SpoVM [Virgibacillus sp. YIM 98842]
MFVKEEEELMKFYTIKLPRVVGGFVRVIIGVFKKEK